MLDHLFLVPHVEAVQPLLWTVAYLAFTAVVFGRNGGEQRALSTSKVLALATALSIILSATIPLVYRLVAPNSAILAWECESLLTYFGALAQGKSLSDFAWESIKANPGVLSASARSIYYGFPTFEVFLLAGAGVFSLRIVAFIAGLLALIPAYYITKYTFNRSIALLFVTVLATNPLYLFYMGYGVSQTGTLLGFLVALALTLAATKTEGWKRFVLAPSGGVAFLVSMYNYSPERIFVVITIASLFCYSCFNLFMRRTNKGVAFALLLTSIVTAGLFGMVKWLEPWSEFFTARGEQVFTLFETRWYVASYLGDTPEVQSYDPANAPLLFKAKFFLAVAQARFGEFLSSMTPLYGSYFSYPRGSQNASSFPLYQSALLIPLVVGFASSLRSLWRARSTYLLLFFFGGLIPLLLTTRFDRHRAFFLLLPLSLWIAHGLYLCLARFGNTALARVHVALITLALGAGLFGNAWFYMALSETTPPEHAALAEAASSLVTPNTSVAFGLDCAPLAPLAVRLMQVERERTPASYQVWEPEFGTFLTDNRFTPTRPEFHGFLDALTRGLTAVLVTDQPTTKFRAELQTRGYPMTEERRGAFVILRVSPKQPSL